MLRLSLPRAFDPQDSSTYPSDGSVCLVVIHRVGEPITKVPPLNDMALVRFVQEDGGAAFVDEHGTILCAATSTLNDAYHCLYFEIELEKDDGVSQEKIDLIESFFSQF